MEQNDPFNSQYYCLHWVDIIDGDGACELVTGKRCGIQFAVADVNGSGRPDIVAPGEDELGLVGNVD